jgi:2-haloacid dehalogenase
MTIPVAFDVLGTCFSLDAAVESLRVEFKDELAATGLRPESLVEDWFHSAQRDVRRVHSSQRRSGTLGAREC